MTPPPSPPELVLSRRDVARVAERDPVFGSGLRDTRGRFLQMIRSAPAYIKTVRDEIRPGEVYRAVIPADVQKGLREKSLEFVTKREGGLFNGMIREATGKKRIVRQTEWVQEKADPQALANLSTVSIQASIADLTEQLLELDRKLDHVLAGQQADRVAEVVGGIEQYEQAAYCSDEATRRVLLGNAAQSLTVGRQKLMQHLKATLELERAEPSTVQKVLTWVTLGRVDEASFEYVQELTRRYPALKEDVRYGNLATAYLFRVHSMLGEAESALASVRQYERFYASLAEGLPEKAPLFPYDGEAGVDLAALAEQAGQLGPQFKELMAPTRDLVIEFDYDEIHADL